MSRMKEERQRLANWIDTEVILDAIMESLEEGGVKSTPANIKQLWFIFIGRQLKQGLHNCVQYSNTPWD